MVIHVNALRTAESVRAHYRVTVDQGTRPEDLLAPGAWVHIARRLRKGDRVELIDQGETWFAEVLVMEVGSNPAAGLKAAFIVGPVELANATVLAKPAELEVRWGGPNALWRVARVKDGAILKDNLASKEAGADWIAANGVLPAKAA